MLIKLSEIIMKIPFVRQPYNYDRDKASALSGLKCEDETLTVQSEKDETDINVIVRRFGLTGVMPQGVRTPTYDDFTGINDYQSALQAMQMANDSFYQMPAEIRSEFDNDPHRFVNFCSDPSNAEKLTSWGLTIHEPVKEPVKAKNDVKSVDIE